MRGWVRISTLSVASLLLVAGCGGEEAGTPDETAPAETTSGTSAPGTTEETTAPASASAQPGTSDTSRAYALDVVTSFGARVEMEVEIADERAEQTRGLNERTELAENAGMLFVFGQEQVVPFSMRDTFIPLSIAFIDADGVIVDIQDAQLLTDGPYVPVVPIQYALGVNQGFFAERGIGVGDVVELPGRPSLQGTLGPDEAIQAFRNAGLEVGETYPVEEEPDWDETRIPKSYTQAVRFRIPSLEGDAGGRVFVFDSEEDLAAVRDFYERLVPSVRPHLYVEGQILLQMTNQLPKADADRYGAALKESV